MPASASQDRFALHPEEQELWTCPLKAQDMGHRLLGLLSWGHNAPSPLFIEQHHPIHFVETAQPSITHTMVQSMNRRAREKKTLIYTRDWRGKQAVLERRFVGVRATVEVPNRNPGRSSAD
ncbi:hypothetical protein VFPBJ_00817 [Purpureocillium lilacinum]|uniref:Uncharacterized protein n=1 Tax=Purpureocillium lilacinum TaxID=33203 RepID=A0A179H9H8_PURLI|nr:hypothetical protein VFPBJ_00817 [Purpureocillium lilacinum]